MSGRWMVAILLGLGMVMALVWYLYLRPTAIRIRQEARTKATPINTSLMPQM